MVSGTQVLWEYIWSGRFLIRRHRCSLPPPIQPLPNFRSAPTSPNGRLPDVFEHPLLREVFFFGTVATGAPGDSLQLFPTHSISPASPTVPWQGVIMILPRAERDLHGRNTSFLMSYSKSPIVMFDFGFATIAQTTRSYLERPLTTRFSVGVFEVTIFSRCSHLVMVSVYRPSRFILNLLSEPSPATPTQQRYFLCSPPSTPSPQSG